jgi:membrane protein DedA with SNARE-associated domain
MTEWIIRTLSDTGYLGVFLLMLAENVFPPIPSELIMPFAGFVAARGELNPVGVVLAGVLGSLAGALPWYGLGWFFGGERVRRLAARHGRWLTVSEAEVVRAEGWFQAYGRWAVLLGRLVPGVRTLISVPAGIARMSFGAFVLWTALGTAVWTALLTVAGYILAENYERVAAILDPAAKIVVGVLVVLYLYRLVTAWKAQRT